MVLFRPFWMRLIFPAPKFCPVKEERAVVHNCISKKKYTTTNDVEEFNKLYYNEKYTIPEISDITNWSIRVIEDKLKDGTIKYNKPRKNELILTTQQLKRIILLK